MTDLDHPKIRLDTISEYKVILNTIEKLAREKLQKHFPPSENLSRNDEEYRRIIEEQVNAYVRKIMDTANLSISINGNDIGNVEEVLKSEEDAKYELYDDALRVKVNELIEQKSKSLSQVSKLRREIPKKSANNYAKKLVSDIDKEILMIESVLKDEDGDVEMIGFDWGVKPLSRQKEVERNWEEAVGILPDLKRGDGELATAQGQVVKAQQILEYIKETK